MRPILLLAAALLVQSAPASAALKEGAAAPMFTASGALAGKPYSFSMKDALKSGPVVLYFFPAAFTPGCTIEANAFAEATPEFAKYKATVVGMSGDTVDVLKDFSVKECRDKFAVASATPDVIRGYDVALSQKPDRTGRTSYVIAQDGRIVYAFTSPDARAHVANTLEAVKRWTKETR